MLEEKVEEQNRGAAADLAPIPMERMERNLVLMLVMEAR